jgi:outer membrane protein OmpA-like peptidoglycan-associated protein
MSGQRDYVIALQERFNQEVPDTITFAFDSAVLDDEAIRVLRHQANWIKQFPELRFKVFGHTDLVGSNSYNYALGQRRANAVVAYFASQGISRSRLEALVSFGETRPVVQTQNEERRNRRTVTEVSGFLRRHPTVLNGKYAEVIFREYIVLAQRAHPAVTQIETQTDPGGN